MNQPWLTTSDWPVSAFDSNAAKNSAASATSSTVVNSPSTVSLKHHIADHLPLPMPLAAPVTTATLSLRRIGLLLATGWPLRGRRKIVMHDFAKSQRKVAQKVHGRDNLKDRQVSHRRHGMRAERQRARARPRALDRDVLEIVLDQL